MSRVGTGSVATGWHEVFRLYIPVTSVKTGVYKYQASKQAVSCSSCLRLFRMRIRSWQPLNERRSVSISHVEHG